VHDSDIGDFVSHPNLVILLTGLSA